MMKTILPIAALLICVSCGFNSNSSQSDNSESAPRNNSLVLRETIVDTMMLSKTVFNKEITCNGRLRAVAKADLNFQGGGRLDEILVYNGDLVKEGDLLAVVDTEDARINLETSTNTFLRAQMDFSDKLIAQGYDADTTSVPKDILANMRISTGFANATENYNAAKRRLEECYLYAPFSGRIANQNSKRFQTPERGVFCTLIDDSYFDVEFSILEAELGDVVKGVDVVVSTFVDESTLFPGVVTQINPVIDDNGQIMVRAKVKNRDGLLIEGMNVKMVIRRKMENMFVVPKDAVLSRDGFFVVFMYDEEDEKAAWTYVDVVMSNIDSHVITGCYEKGSEIHENDIVITKGNINLSDGSSVKVRE